MITAEEVVEASSVGERSTDSRAIFSGGGMDRGEGRETGAREGVEEGCAKAASSEGRAF